MTCLINGKVRIVGDFQLEVLKTIISLGLNASGVMVRDRLEQIKCKTVHLPQVYSALKKLNTLELVSSHQEALSSAGKRGRPRLIYSLTKPGHKILQAGGICSLKALYNEGTSMAH